MKMFLDFFPVILFFVVYQLTDIYVATIAAIVASVVQVAWYKLKHGIYEKTYVITLVLMVVLGGATLLLQDEMFVKWKPTVVNWLFAVVLIGSHFIGQKTIIERMMGNAVQLPAHLWPRFNIAWAVFFIVLGLINLFVVYNFDTDTWVNFKLFGIFGLTFAFVIAQGMFMIKYVKLQTQDAKD